MATAGDPRRRRTWSLFDGERRRPDEYDIVTRGFHYHYGRRPAPFDLDPRSAINQWYLRYREGSLLQAPDWEGFRDPGRLNYRRYVALQNDREIYAEGVVDSFEADDHDARLDPAWVAVLGRAYLPARFALHVLQITSMYVAQLGPGAAITNAALFQGADELRALQWIAYRAKSLSLTHGAGLADSGATRAVWEDDPAWQPAREALELLLLAYDWGEAFVALNLVVKPAFDALFKESFADLADAHGDGLTARLLKDSGADTARSQAWSTALTRYALAARPDNLKAVTDWQHTWTPRATAAVEGLAAVFATAPRPADPREVAAAVTTSTERLSGAILS
ncbi:toluene hydroxylase [Nonomuraea sp. PA05]|uniref:toluene hydroxylase n=1 Tax=Nonomuraea sp. PA05 TaxID=2604466 RepID=UPI0011D4CE48|nr:toluene hydroxylase [Nonomuraea sp. PA05]TYB66824.1 toluene hydroxylase [Nonomuraea sp. PA05]